MPRKTRPARTMRHRHDTPPVIAATQEYEDWLGHRVEVIKGDLDKKHSEMARHLFPFLRATFYRWVPLWRNTCADLWEAPRVLAVGDRSSRTTGPGGTKKAA